MNKEELRKETIEREKQYLKDLLKKTILGIKAELPLEGEFRDIISKKLEFVSAYHESYEDVDAIEYEYFELRTIKGETYILYVCYCPLEFIFLFKANMTYVINKKTRKLALVDISDMRLKLDLVRTF
jgi:hypothetical protein